MRKTEVVVIGGGQAGLAMSRCLAASDIDHVVLERGRIAQSWRDRWDSLRLLTPNWQTRLPGHGYRGSAPDGFMTRGQVVGYLESYAAACDAPLHEATRVSLVTQAADGQFSIRTNTFEWLARNVVIATGHCAKAHVPALADRLDKRIRQLTPDNYRNPADLEPGSVLIVGASSTGVQLAHEMNAAGHPVTLSVGRHTRLPRSYRGRDIMYWLDATGILHERIDQVRSPEASRRSPSLQLVGSDDGHSLDLGTLMASGVRLVGRALAAEGRSLRFAEDLAETVGASDNKLRRILSRIDTFIDQCGLSRDVEPPSVLDTIPLPKTPTELELDSEGIRNVFWATGYSRCYPWLQLPVLNDAGEIENRAGVTEVPGVYALGLNFMRRRSSSYIDGVGADAHWLCDVIEQRRRRWRSVA